jgi:hypothetical protein
MKAKPVEYLTYVSQSVMATLINAIVLFMLAKIHDDVRRNNPANFMSDEELVEAAEAKKAAKEPAPAPVEEAPKATAPATPEKRQEVTKTLTAPDSPATELQIKGLKAAMAKLLEADPAQENFVAQIALQTNGLTEITKADCETLVQAITALLEGK